MYRFYRKAVYISNILALLLCVFQCKKQTEPDIALTSPDGKILLSFNLDSLSVPCYHVEFGDQVIITNSSLGMEFLNGFELKDLEIVQLSRVARDTVYNIIAGKSKTARDFYNELLILLREKKSPKRKIEICFRAYNDGIAFRYIIPKQSTMTRFELIAEKSEFRFPENYACWALRLDGFTTSYEDHYQYIHIDSMGKSYLIGLPLTMQTPSGTTIAITEANLTDYAGMYLEGDSKDKLSLKSRLSPLPDNQNICVRGTLPHKSPWRVVMIGDQPGDLIESNIILNLNDPCKISDTSWIKPGKVVFPWWPDFKTESPVIGNEMTFDNQKYYLDFATEYEIPYLELEPPWYGDERECIKNPEKFDITTPTRSLQLPDLLEYGKERGVHFFIWAVWKNIEQQMNTALPLYEQWGAAGMKIDFMNRDDQDMVNFYHRVLQKAAEHHLMVYFHGAYKPTGIRRTWPNLLTREAVMGLEYNKWTDRITPEHNVTLPFTRMLAGPMDYTPGAFVNVTKDQFKPEYSEPMAMGTRCHQLAMYIVYESPLQMVADCPGNYRSEKSAEFLKIVPTTWDETRVLVGKIGDYIAVARRSGMDWYIGAMTDWTPRELDLSLDFLGENTFYATIYADGNAADENPELVTITKIKLHSKDHLITKLAPGGGVAVHMTPVIKNNPSLKRIK